MKTIISISFKQWLNLWRTLALTLAQLALGLVIILFRGLVKTTVHAYKGLIKWIGAHPTGALTAFAFCIAVVALLSSVRSGIERQDLSRDSHRCHSSRSHRSRSHNKVLHRSHNGGSYVSLSNSRSRLTPPNMVMRIRTPFLFSSSFRPLRGISQGAINC